MVADMVANKKIKLFMRGIKLKSYFVVPKTIKLKTKENSNK